MLRLFRPLLIASTVCQAEESASLRAANRLRHAGIGVLAVGVIASVVSQVLVGKGIGWELGNGLGEHYDPTPSWVPIYENTGWGLLAGSQVAIIGGISMLSAGDTERDRARVVGSVAVRF